MDEVWLIEVKTDGGWQPLQLAQHPVVFYFRHPAEGVATMLEREARRHGRLDRYQASPYVRRETLV